MTAAVANQAVVCPAWCDDHCAGHDDGGVLHWSELVEVSDVDGEGDLLDVSLRAMVHPDGQPMPNEPVLIRVSGVHFTIAQARELGVVLGRLVELAEERS